MAMRKPTEWEPGNRKRTNSEGAASAVRTGNILVDGAGRGSDPRRREISQMRVPERINGIALVAVAVLFFVLALTPVGELWEQHPEVRDVYLWIGMFALGLSVVVRRAEHRRVDSLDRWMAAVWTMAGFALIGLSPLWPVLFLGLLFGAIIRLEAKLAFQRSDELAQAVGIR